ncbi:MAG: tRNA pseudouridine(38-40) synthase TruA [Clostridia bacterium]
MRNLVIVIEYDGSGFCGWQSQKNGITIQDQVQKALKSVLNEDVILTASGRTDEGVHAKGQVANFYTENPIKCYKLPLGANLLLAPKIAIKECYETDLNFNARKSAVKKTYCYRIYMSATPSPLRDRTYFQTYRQLDIKKMKEAATYFIGIHDFVGFMATGSNSFTTIREIYSCEIINIGDSVEIYVCGNAFLYNMVRIIAGTLLAVGQNRIKPNEISAIIESKDRKRAGKTLLAKGLTLESVEY